jgi:hypothetical protein
MFVKYVKNNMLLKIINVKIVLWDTDSRIYQVESAFKRLKTAHPIVQMFALVALYQKNFKIQLV